MTSRPNRLITAAAVAALTASAAAIGVVTSAGPAAAKATAPVWYRLSSGPGINISNQPSVTRVGGQLTAVWTQGNSAINSRVVSAIDKPIGPVTPVVSGWYSMTGDPQILTLGGVPTVVFAGHHTSATTDTLNGPVLYAQRTAAGWALGPGSLTHDTDTSTDAGLAAVDDGTGQPILTAAGSSTNHLTVHHGIDAAVPAAALDSETGNLGETQDVNMVRDKASGIAYAAYYSASDDASMGIHAAEVYPGISAASSAAPFSIVRYDGKPTTSDPGQNIALAARVGGGVWAAYGSGYPSPHKLVLWNLQTGRTLTLTRPTGEIQYVSLSAAPGGRLWVSWIEGSTIMATRTNPSVTKFGVVRAVASPALDGTSPTRLAGDGTLGPLDAVTNVIGKGDKDASGNLISEIYATHIYEGLAVSVSPGTISATRGGTVVAAVTDAGVPVRGVYVKVGGVTKKTNASGTATFAIPKNAAKGTDAVTAYGLGWYSGRTTFKVR